MKQRIAAALTLLLWGYLSYIGYKTISGVIEQHAPGYPTAGQWAYYVCFPLTMAIVSIGLMLLTRRMPIGLFVTIWLLQVSAIVPFVFGFAGGV